MRRHLPACPAERVLCGSLSVTAGHAGRPWATCASSFPCSPHWLRPLPFRGVPSRWRPNIPFSETVNSSALIICSFYVFYATHGIFLSRDLKVFVPDFALGARLPAWVSLVAQMAKNHLPMQDRRVGSLGQKDPLEEEMAACSRILAWGTPWMQEPDGLQSTGSQRVGPNVPSKQTTRCTWLSGGQ